MTALQIFEFLLMFVSLHVISPLAGVPGNMYPKKYVPPGTYFLLFSYLLVQIARRMFYYPAFSNEFPSIFIGLVVKFLYEDERAGKGGQKKSTKIAQSWSTDLVDVLFCTNICDTDTMRNSRK